MSAHDNAALARRIYQLFSDDKLDDALELVAEDVEAVLVPFGQTFHGREGFTTFMQGFKGAFPDIRIAVTSAPSQNGVRIHVRECDHWEFRDGKVIRKDSYWKIVEQPA